MPTLLTDAQRSRFLLAVCESYIIQSNGQRRYPSWDRVKTFLGPEFPTATRLRYFSPKPCVLCTFLEKTPVKQVPRNQYQHIRQRLINAGDNESGSGSGVPSTTPTKRPHGDAFKPPSGSGDGGELEDDCEEGMVSEDVSLLKIKLEAPQDLVDADDLYSIPARMALPSPRGQEKWERFTPWPGHTASPPSPPSPPPPPSPSPPRRQGAKRRKTKQSAGSDALWSDAGPSISPQPPTLPGPRGPVAPPSLVSHAPLQPQSQRSVDFVIWP